MASHAILIHGTASNSFDTWERNGWLELLRELGIHTTMAALPGHAGSALPATASLDQSIASVLDLAPQCDTLIGFSAGATLALHTAIAHPNEISTLILLGMGDGFWADPDAKQRTAEQVRQGVNDPFVRLMRNMIINTGNDLNSVCDYIATAAGPPPLDRLQDLRARTLIVCGVDDMTNPPNKLREAIPNAEAFTPKQVDHFRTVSAPSVMLAVSRFLRPPG